jgi:hypothetical protein
VRRQPRCTLPLRLSGKLQWDLGRVGPGTSITSASLASMLFRERRGRTWGGGLEATLRCQRVALACRVVDEAFPVGAWSLAEFHIIKPTVSPSSRLVFWLLAGAAPRHSFRCKSCWQGRLGASAFLAWRASPLSPLPPARQARRQRQLLRRQLARSAEEATQLRSTVARLRQQSEYTLPRARPQSRGSGPILKSRLSTLGLYRLALKRNLGHSSGALRGPSGSCRRPTLQVR